MWGYALPVLVLLILASVTQALDYTCQSSSPLGTQPVPNPLCTREGPGLPWTWVARSSSSTTERSNVPLL